MKRIFEGMDFGAYYAAETYALEQGFSIGSMCGDLPIGIMRGEYYIAKWRNLNVKERKQMHGIITSLDFRSGPVTVEVFERVIARAALGTGGTHE